MSVIVVRNVSTAQEMQLHLDVDTLSMMDNGSRDAARSSFTLHDPDLAFDLVEEDELQITDVDPGTATDLFGGFARTVRCAVNGTGRIWTVTGYDYSTLLDRVDVVTVDRPGGETLRDRLAYFMVTFADGLLDDDMTHVLDVADLPAQKFRLLSLRQAIEKVLGTAGLTLAYKVRADKKLEVWDTDDGNGTAPYDIRIGTPGAGEIAPEDLEIEGASSDLRNVYWVRGATAAGSGYRTSPSSITRFGRREAYQDAPDADLAWKAANVGNAALRDNEWPKRTGTFTAYSPHDGWRSRQRILVTSPMHITRDRVAFDGEPFDIASVQTQYLNGAGDRRYTVTIGTPRAKFTARKGRELRRHTTGPGGGGGGGWIPDPGGGGSYGPGSEGPWWAGATLTIDGLSGDQLIVWTDSGNAPTVTGSGTVLAVAAYGGVFLVTWTADGTLLIENTP